MNKSNKLRTKNIMVCNTSKVHMLRIVKMIHNIFFHNPKKSGIEEQLRRKTLYQNQLVTSWKKQEIQKIFLEIWEMDFLNISKISTPRLMILALMNLLVTASKILTKRLLTSIKSSQTIKQDCRKLQKSEKIWLIKQWSTRLKI